MEDNGRNMCDTQLKEDITLLMNQCLHNMNNKLANIVNVANKYVLITEVILYIIFASFVQSINPLRVLSIGLPFMIAIYWIYVVISIVYFISLMYRVGCVIDAYNRRHDTARVSRNVFVYCADDVKQTADISQDRNNKSLYFNYRENGSYKYIKLDLKDKQLYYEQLVEGREYRFVTIDDKYLLVINNRDYDELGHSAMGQNFGGHSKYNY